MTTQTLQFRKEDQYYVFRYVRGRESDVMAAITHAAEDTRINLDWMDAARLSFQVARNAVVFGGIASPSSAT